MKKQLAALLAAGVKQNQAAAAIGVTDSYVSQLVHSDEEFQQLLQEEKSRLAAITQLTEAQLAHDKTIDEVEKHALDRVKSLIQYETNPMRALKVFQIMNAAIRRSEGIVPDKPADVVNITLPQQMQVIINLTTDKQVVEVGGRSLATMPSHKVQARLREQKALALVRDSTPTIDAATAAKLAKF